MIVIELFFPSLQVTVVSNFSKVEIASREAFSIDQSLVELFRLVELVQTCCDFLDLTLYNIFLSNQLPEFGLSVHKLNNCQIIANKQLKQSGSTHHRNNNQTSNEIGSVWPRRGQFASKKVRSSCLLASCMFFFDLGL